MPRKDKDQRLGTKSSPMLTGKDEVEKLKMLSSMKYEHQCKWFLNVRSICSISWSCIVGFGMRERERESRVEIDRYR